MKSRYLALLLSLRSFFVSLVVLRNVNSALSFSPLATTSSSSHGPLRGREGRQKRSSRDLWMASTRTPLSTRTNRTTDSDEFDGVNPIPLNECEEILEVAERAARAAGKIIVENLGCSSEASGDDPSSSKNKGAEIKFNIKDVVTQYDKLAQEVIESIIQERYPNFYFLGEENVAAGARASEEALTLALQKTKSEQRNEANASDVPTTTSRMSMGPGFTFIVDPIDGTANFASGLPLCAVTMSVVYQDLAVIGIVYDPHRDEFFSAIRGHGTWLKANDGERKRLQVQTSITKASDAIVNAGCPADPNAFETSMKGMLALNSQVRGVRVVACSALTLAWIASGRLTAHFGYDLSSWDLVAGALLIQEAGGRITDLDGSAYAIETRNMLCSNGRVHDEILAILEEAGATSFVRSE
mmetsp:Transcript_19501/g.34293  ORF Transcript_19501/g.34293 Transcript_19501/m.34293 type:complete len:413 (+) Transcript_19501:2-1240(+)